MKTESRNQTAFDDYYPTLGSRVPLRSGTWSILTEVRRLKTSISFVQGFLVRIESDRLQEAARVTSFVNTSTEDETYRCIGSHKSELYKVVEENQENGSQAVWSVMNFVSGPWTCFHDRTTGISDFEAGVAERLSKGGTSFPAEFLRVNFIRREQHKALEANYYLNPELFGLQLTAHNLLSWRDSDFAPHNIRSHPEKFEFFRHAVEWGEGWWPRFKSCFLDFYPEGF